MGRTIIADENIQSVIKHLISLPDCVVGLVIGQNTQQKDFICHLANTPKEESDLDSDESSVNISNKGKTKEKSKQPLTIENFDEALIIHHAKQVNRMLPGGIDILGIFTVLANETLSSNILSKLKQILINIFKMLKKQANIPPHNEITDKIILHLQPFQKVSAKVFDLSNIYNSAKPAEFRFQSGGLSWHQLECRLALDLSIPISVEDSKLSLIKQIQIGLSPLHSAIDSAVILIDGLLKSSNDLLDSNKELRRGKHKEKSLTIVKHNAEIYVESLPLPVKVENILKCGAKMQLKGTLQSRAYVNNKANFQEATQAIKQDLLRSLFARFEIHCEDGLIIDEEQQDPCVVHEPPRRVFAPLPGSNLTVSDYLFPGEKAQDSLEAFKELLSLSLTEKDIEIDCERLADPNDLASNISEVKTNISTSYDILTSTTHTSNCNILVVALTIAVAVLAICVCFLLLRETQ